MRLVAWLLVGAVTVSVPACAILEGMDKVSKTPGLEQAQLKKEMEKRPAPTGQQGALSPLQAIPSALDFGTKGIASQNQETVAISNPSGFAVTVIQISVQGDGFALSGAAPDRPVIAPHGQLALTVIFQPATRRSASGLLLLEIDSAGGRFTRVALHGRGT